MLAKKKILEPFNNENMMRVQNDVRMNWQVGTSSFKRKKITWHAEKHEEKKILNEIMKKKKHLIFNKLISIIVDDEIIYAKMKFMT